MTEAEGISSAIKNPRLLRAKNLYLFVSQFSPGAHYARNKNTRHLSSFVVSTTKAWSPSVQMSPEPDSKHLVLVESWSTSHFSWALALSKS